MVKIEEEGREGQEEIVGLTWDELARLGAQRMLEAALEAEVSAYVAAHREERAAQGRALVVRNGPARGRQVTIGSGTLTVQAPRGDDRREDAAGERRRFRSGILPPDRRRSPKVAEVLPMLYRRGLSPGAFREALPVLLGEEAAGLSPTAIPRLTAPWETAYTACRPRDLSARDDVSIWVDGVHFAIRLDDERRCTLVGMGARADGTQAVMAVEDGYHARPESWLTLWRDLKRRGMPAPAVAVGDGARGFWKAGGEVWPEPREQRCWVHRLATVRDKWPQRLQPQAKRALRESMNAATRADAEAAITALTAEYQAKYPKAVASLDRDQEKRLTCFDFPAEHGLRWRTTNPVEFPVQHGAVAATGDQGGRGTGEGLGHGVQAVGDGRRALAQAERTASAAARPGHGDVCRWDAAAQA